MRPVAGPGDPDAASDPRTLAAQFELVQRQLQSLDRRLAGIEEALVEAQQAATTVKALGDAQGEQDTLLPLGSGVHVRARVDASAPILLPVGAGYFTEGPAAEVATALQQRVEALTRAFQDASAEAERLAQTAAAINDRLSSLSP